MAGENSPLHANIRPARGRYIPPRPLPPTAGLKFDAVTGQPIEYVQQDGSDRVVSATPTAGNDSIAQTRRNTPNLFTQPDPRNGGIFQSRQPIRNPVLPRNFALDPQAVANGAALNPLSPALGMANSVALQAANAGIENAGNSQKPAPDMSRFTNDEGKYQDDETAPMADRMTAWANRKGLEGRQTIGPGGMTVNGQTGTVIDNGRRRIETPNGSTGATQTTSGLVLDRMTPQEAQDIERRYASRDSAGTPRPVQGRITPGFITDDSGNRYNPSTGQVQPAAPLAQQPVKTGGIGTAALNPTGYNPSTAIPTGGIQQPQSPTISVNPPVTPPPSASRIAESQNNPNVKNPATKYEPLPPSSWADPAPAIRNSALWLGESKETPINTPSPASGPSGLAYNSKPIQGDYVAPPVNTIQPTPEDRMARNAAGSTAAGYTNGTPPKSPPPAQNTVFGPPIPKRPVIFGAEQPAPPVATFMRKKPDDEDIA